MLSGGAQENTLSFKSLFRLSHWKKYSAPNDYFTTKDSNRDSIQQEKSSYKTIKLNENKKIEKVSFLCQIIANGVSGHFQDLILFHEDRILISIKPNDFSYLNLMTANNDDNFPEGFVQTQTRTVRVGR